MAARAFRAITWLFPRWRARTELPALLAEATDQLNRQQVPRLGAMILARLPKGGTAGVLGLSYKPDTGVIEESQGVALAKYLLQSGAKVVVYDPEAMDNARVQLQGQVTFAPSPAECARQADVLAITTPWPEFKKLTPQDFKRPTGKASGLGLLAQFFHARSSKAWWII